MPAPPAAHHVAVGMPGEQMSYPGFLAGLLRAECDDRARRRSERRIKAAAFPRERSLRAFDFGASLHVDTAAAGDGCRQPVTGLDAGLVLALVWHGSGGRRRGCGSRGLTVRRGGGV
jgi:hypothetical protein